MKSKSRRVGLRTTDCLVSVGLVIVSLLSAFSAAGCRSSNPASPTPSVAQVQGLWSYHARLTGTSGNDGSDCVAFSPALGTVDSGSGSGTVEIRQTGTSLEATRTSSGASCSYAGTAGADSIALNATRCWRMSIRSNCSSEVDYNLFHRTSSINLTVEPSGTASGTAIDSWDLFDPRMQVSGDVITLHHSFTMTKQ